MPRIFEDFEFFETLKSLVHSVSSGNVQSPLRTLHCKQIFTEKELLGLRPHVHIHVYVSNLHMFSQDQSAYSVTGKYVDRSWEYMNGSQTHECGIGTEATLFLVWEYINGIFVAVQVGRVLNPQRSLLSN